MFNQTLEKNLPLPHSREALLERFAMMMKNYEEFFNTNPELYHIIFSSPQNGTEENLELKEVSSRGFAHLLNQIASMKAAGLLKDPKVFETSLFTFIVAHGYFSLKNNNIIYNLFQLFLGTPPNEEFVKKYLFQALELKWIEEK